MSNYFEHPLTEKINRRLALISPRQRKRLHTILLGRNLYGQFVRLMMRDKTPDEIIEFLTNPDIIPYAFGFPVAQVPDKIYADSVILIYRKKNLVKK